MLSFLLPVLFFNSVSHLLQLCVSVSLPWGEFTCFFSYGPLVRFVFDALHSSSDLFVILCVSVLVTSLVAKWLFLPLRFILSGS